MTRYEVDVPAVDGLSSQVSAGAVEVRGALGRLRAAECVDAGDAGLGAALSAFEQVWAAFTEASAQVVDGTARAISADAWFAREQPSVMPGEVVWLDTTEQGAALGSSVPQGEQT